MADRGGDAIVNTPPDASTTGLAPITGMLLDRAHRDAGRIRAEARATADDELTHARADAAGILAAARVAGAGEAESSAGTQLVHARRRARAIVLAARRQVYEELCRRVRAELAAWCDDTMTGRLRDLALERAGPGARVVATPDGGVAGVGAGVRVDCSISALADHAVDLLGSKVGRLWAC